MADKPIRNAKVSPIQPRAQRPPLPKARNVSDARTKKSAQNYVHASKGKHSA
jgi:hypothetical protein